MKHLLRVHEKTHFALLAILLGLAGTAGGCSGETSSADPAVVVVRGDSPFDDPSFHHGPPGGTIGPLTVQVLGPVIQGVPGRNGRRDPVPGVEVTFRFKFFFREENQYIDSLSFPELVARLGVPPANAPASTGERGEGTALPLAPRFVPHREFPEESGATQLGSEKLEQRDPEDRKSGEEPPRPPVEKIDVATVKTDDDGYARVNLQLGRFVGEFRVEAEIDNQFAQSRTVDFWIISGLEILAHSPREREGPPGSLTDLAIRFFENEEGWTPEPQDDRAVFFSVVETPGVRSGARLEKDKDRTNSEGIAKIDLRLGERPGVTKVLVEIEPTDDFPAVRGFVVDFFVFDTWRCLGWLAAGAALFLIGLRWLANGLLIQLGAHLHLPTGAFASSRVVGLLGGTAIGALFLSSSTVVSRLMIFASGGLLSAQGAAGQILGVNLGKTLLILVLALGVGDALAVPLTVFGVVLTFTPGRVGARPWGQILLGLGLVFFAWTMFVDVAELARSSPGFTELLRNWDPAIAATRGSGSWIIFCVDLLVAMIVCFTVRSSNLLVALALAFVSVGLLSPEASIAVICGASIGSSLAIVAKSLRRRREARRLALEETIFFVLGSVWLIAASSISIGEHSLILHVVEWLTPGRFFHPQPENSALHVAVLFTMFHLVNAVALIGATPWVLRLARRIVPRDPVHDDVKPFQLDPGLVDVPALALTQATREVVYLVEILRKVIAESFDAFRYRDLNLADQIGRREETINTLRREVSRYLLLVSRNNLSLPLASRLEGLQAAVGNLAPIAKQGEALRDLATRAIEERAELGEKALRDLTELYDLIMAQFENVLRLLENPDRGMEEKAVKLGERLTRSATRIEGAWFKRARQGEDEDTALSGSELLAEILGRDAYAALALVARQLADVAERMRLLAVD